MDPARHVIVCYIYVAGWWVKPTFANPKTPINPDGTWTCDITTGGIDQLATRIAAFLVPISYPPLPGGEQTLPGRLYANALAYIIVERTAVYRTIQFSGYTWKVKASETPAGPGPNYFSDRADDVWVDAQGRLHLRIAQHNGQWYATEVINNESLGTASTRLRWPARSTRWIPTSCWACSRGMILRRSTPIASRTSSSHAGATRPQPTPSMSCSRGIGRAIVIGSFWQRVTHRTVHHFQWLPDRIDFASHSWDAATQGLGDELAAWQYTGPDVHPAGGENARINLWLLDGKPPTDGQLVEVIVESFRFAPQAASAAINSAGVVDSGRRQAHNGEHPEMPRRTSVDAHRSSIIILQDRSSWRHCHEIPNHALWPAPGTHLPAGGAGAVLPGRIRPSQDAGQLIRAYGYVPAKGGTMKRRHIFDLAVFHGRLKWVGVLCSVFLLLLFGSTALAHASQTGSARQSTSQPCENAHQISSLAKPLRALSRYKAKLTGICFRRRRATMCWFAWCQLPSILRFAFMALTAWRFRAAAPRCTMKP